MHRLIIITFSLLSICSGYSQSIDGIYTAYEFNKLEIDSSGKVRFYGVDSFPKERWFYEVWVSIKSNQITISKSPVVFNDSIKIYSASDGGFITYKGPIVKSGDIFFAKVKMHSYDYIGFSIFDAPRVINDFDTSHVDTPLVKISIKEQERELKRTHDWIQKDGMYVFFPKGFLRQDYIIKPDKKGIWINNVFYRRAKQDVDRDQKL